MNEEETKKEQETKVEEETKMEQDTKDKKVEQAKQDDAGEEYNDVVLSCLPDAIIVDGDSTVDSSQATVVQTPSKPAKNTVIDLVDSHSNSTSTDTSATSSDSEDTNDELEIPFFQPKEEPYIGQNVRQMFELFFSEYLPRKKKIICGVEEVDESNDNFASLVDVPLPYLWDGTEGEYEKNVL